MSEYKTKLLSYTDVLRAWGKDVDAIVNVVEQGFRAHDEGKVIFPDKSSQVFDEKTQSRINCMPSTVIPSGLAGVKWVSVFPQNPSKRGIANVGGVMVLSEIESGQTLAIMAASALTAIRTAAVDALAARYLAPRLVRSVAILGTGQQAAFHARFLARADSGIIVKIAGRNAQHARSLVEELRSEGIEAFDFGCDMEGAVRSSQIIVTATSGQEPILKADWVAGGTLYCHVGGWEDEFAVPKKADLIICDDWNALKHRGSPTIARMYQRGLLEDDDVFANLAEVMFGKKMVSNREGKFIYFNAIGLSYIDVVVAGCLFYRAQDLGIGDTFQFEV